jgi:hypothetical protein
MPIDIRITVNTPSATEIAVTQNVLAGVITGLNGQVPAASTTTTSAGTGTTRTTTGTGTGTQGGTGTTTASGNLYPLAMPSGITGGAPFTIGAGNDTITLLVSNDPGRTGNNEFNLIGNFGTTETAIAAGLVTTAEGGLSAGANQTMTIRGDFSGLTGLQMTSAGAGLSGLWVNQVAVNLVPWLANADAANSRGTGSPSYQTALFNSNGSAMLWLPPSAIPTQAVPPPAATPTSIVGATINGTAQAANTLQNLINATAAASPNGGGVLLLPAGTITDTAQVPVAMTIDMVGADPNIMDTIIRGPSAASPTLIFDGTGVTPKEDKACLVPLVPGVVVRNAKFQNWRISAALGQNCSPVRESGPGIGATMDGCEVTACDNGTLTSGGNWGFVGSYHHDNGVGNGLSHECYIDGDTNNIVTLTKPTFACGKESTHALKTRAGTTNLSGGTLTGSADPTGSVGGSVVDVPDAGVFSATGTTFVTSAGAANTLFLSYGLESAKNAAIGNGVKLTDCVFTDNTGTGGKIQGPGGTATLDLVGCTYTGAAAPAIAGFVVTGSFAKAA